MRFVAGRTVPMSPTLAAPFSTSIVTVIMPSTLHRGFALQWVRMSEWVGGREARLRLISYRTLYGDVERRFELFR